MRRAAAALLCLLLLCACAAPEQADALPQELVGSWVSAGNGDLIETMTLAQDGTISVQCTFRGKDTGRVARRRADAFHGHSGRHLALSGRIYLGR